MSFTGCVGINLCTEIRVCLCLTLQQSLVYTSVQKHMTEDLYCLFVVCILIKGRWSFPYLEQGVLVSVLFSHFKRDFVCIKKSSVEHDLTVSSSKYSKLYTGILKGRLKKGDKYLGGPKD